MARSPEGVRAALTRAVDRRTEAHDRMVAGEIAVDVYRALAATETHYIDRLLDELSAAR